MRNLTAVFMTTVLCLTAFTASSQETATESSEPVKTYLVELLIFRNLDQSGNTTEIPRMAEPELAEELDTELARLADTNPDVSASEVAEQSGPEWSPANPKDGLLAGTARSIQQLRAYELISHLAWTQTAPDVADALPLNIAELGAPAAQLSGDVELHKRRYLHLALDIALAGSNTTTEPVMDAQALPAGITPPPSIRDSRRIRLEKLNYFDQPKFGVIAVVSRVEDEDAS